MENGWIFQIETIKKHLNSQLENFQPCYSDYYCWNSVAVTFSAPVMNASGMFLFSFIDVCFYFGLARVNIEDN